MFDFIKRLFKGSPVQSKEELATSLTAKKQNNQESIEANGPIAEEDKEDNYLSGHLTTAHRQHEMQARKAGLSYWERGLAKYRPRQRRAVIDGANAKDFRYFEAIRLDPNLRQLELQNPGMCLELLDLNTFINTSLKGKMVGQFIQRSMQTIHAEQANDASKSLKELINKHESGVQVGAVARPENPTENQIHLEDNVFMHNQELANTWTKPKIEDNFKQVEELFQPSSEAQNQESYTSWLLSIAEAATEPDDVLWLLVIDNNPDVRFCLAENYNINQSILIELSHDDNPYVAHRAQKTLNNQAVTIGKVLEREFGNVSGKNRKTGTF